jgi:hypothetical protein
MEYCATPACSGQEDIHSSSQTKVMTCHYVEPLAYLQSSRIHATQSPLRAHTYQKSQTERIQTTVGMQVGTTFSST